MVTNCTRRESDLFEKWRITLEKATSQPDIAAAISELGYTSEVVAKGKDFYAKARAAYDSNRVEGDEAIAASKIFGDEVDTLDAIYVSHRKKAKYVFRNDANAARELDVHVPKPEAYLPWIKSVKKFYNCLSTNDALCVVLTTFKVTVADIAAAKQHIDMVEKARADYIRALGEAKDAVAAKDAAFAEVETWMRDFYTVARIALEDCPTLFATLFK
jgi:hypothetical protein